jgi:adenylyltransferase/sulfurtransferase
VIAGIEVQEAVKLLHGLPTLAGSGFVFEGLNHTSYKVEYTANPDCMSHFTFESATSLPRKSSQWTLEDLRRRGAEDLGAKNLSAQDALVEFSRDIVHELECPACGTKEEVFAPVGSIRFEQGRCPRDGQMRVVKTIHSYDGSEDFGKRTLDQLGLPLFDVFTVRMGEKEQAYLMAGDKSAVLGEGL